MRFSIKQMLLLFVLMSLIGGTLSAVLRQPPSNEAHRVAVSPDGTKIAVIGGYGLDVYDLETEKRIDSVQWNNPFGAMVIPGSDRHVKFLDNDRIVFLKPDRPFGSPAKFMSYSISQRKESLLDRDATNRTPMAVSNAIGFLNSPQIENTHIVVFDMAGVSATFHELETMEESTVAYASDAQFPALRLSPSGQFVVIGEFDFYQSEFDKLEFFDRATGQSIGELVGKANRVWFSPDDSTVMVYDESKLSTYSVTVVTSPQTDSAEAHLSSTDLVESGPIPDQLDLNRTELTDAQSAEQEDKTTNHVNELSGLKLEFSELWSMDQIFWDSINPRVVFSEDGSKVAFFTDYLGTDIKVVEAASGNAIQELHSGSLFRNSSCFAFHPDNKRIVVCPNNSDNPIKVFDADSGQLVKSFGENWRFFKALSYGLGFIAWSLVWGLFSTDQKKQRPEARTESTDDMLKIDAPVGGPESANDEDVVDAQVADSRSRSIEVHSSRLPNAGLANTPSVGLVVAWSMLGVGGCFAILWSAIPMFYLHNGLLGHLSSILVIVRMILAGFGIFVGVLAVTRAFGRSPRRLKTAAVFQMGNIINLDVVNFILGIVVLVLISSASAQRRINELVRNNADA